MYARIYNDLRNKIESGELIPGQRINTEIELSKSYGVSRDSVRRALSLLENEGFIIRKVSSGTFVRETKTQYAPYKFHESFTEQMIRQGKHPSSQIRSIEMLSGDLSAEICEALELGPEEQVYRLKRIRLADKLPMAYEIAYIRQKFCPDLHTHLLEDSSLYKLYEEFYHLDMGDIDLKIEAVNADSNLQKILSLKQSEALLKMTSRMRLRDDQPLYYVVCYHVGARYEYTTSMPRRLT